MPRVRPRVNLNGAVVKAPCKAPGNAAERAEKSRRSEVQHARCLCSVCLRDGVSRVCGVSCTTSIARNARRVRRRAGSDRIGCLLSLIERKHETDRRVLYRSQSYTSSTSATCSARLSGLRSRLSCNTLLSLFRPGSLSRSTPHTSIASNLPSLSRRLRQIATTDMQPIYVANARSATYRRQIQVYRPAHVHRTQTARKCRSRRLVCAALLALYLLLPVAHLERAHKLPQRNTSECQS